MNSSAPEHAETVPVDDDLAEQARTGHGIPSQDPNPAAQFSMTPQESAREVKSALMGGGVVAGVATGAAVGVAVAGPAGALVGAAVGAVAGTLGGAAAGARATAKESGQADTPSADSIHLPV